MLPCRFFLVKLQRRQVDRHHDRVEASILPAVLPAGFLQPHLADRQDQFAFFATGMNLAAAPCPAPGEPKWISAAAMMGRWSARSAGW